MGTIKVKKMAKNGSKSSVGLKDNNCMVFSCFMFRVKEDEKGYKIVFTRIGIKNGRNNRM